MTLKLALAMAGGLLLGSVAQAAEYKVLTSVALKSALDELAPQYEKMSGNKLTIGYGLIAELRKRILEGETADLIILSAPVMEELGKQGKVASGTPMPIVSTAVAIAVKAGAPKPDISSADALKKTLLAAKSIVYADPAKGGASGVHFAKVLDRLGIADQMKAKTILVPGAQAGEVVAKGEAELGIAQASEIVPVAGVQLVGALPAELGAVTVFAASFGAGTKDAPTQLVRFLKGPTAVPVFKSKGLEP
jgi:molybdate transport system substrate-binding protein